MANSQSYTSDFEQNFLAKYCPLRRGRIAINLCTPAKPTAQTQTPYPPYQPNPPMLKASQPHQQPLEDSEATYQSTHSAVVVTDEPPRKSPQPPRQGLPWTRHLRQTCDCRARIAGETPHLGYCTEKSNVSRFAPSSVTSCRMRISLTALQWPSS